MSSTRPGARGALIAMLLLGEALSAVRARGIRRVACMRRPSLRGAWAIAIGSTLLAAPTLANAQQGGPYSLTKSAIAAGGAMFSTSVSPAYSLGGTIGQSSPGPLTGGNYSLYGGFWGGGTASLLGVPDDPTDLPIAFLVHSNVPNPFSGTTTIGFDLPTDQRVTMEVINLNGQRVRLLLDQIMPAGRHQMTWAGIGDDGRPMTPGVYWIRTLAGNRRDVRKAVLVK